MITKRRCLLFSPVPAAAAAAAGGSAAAGAGAGAGTAGAVAGGISAGAASLDAIGGQAFGIANLILQTQAYKEQRDWQQYMYEDQKKLADPAYRMARLRLAGLNPYGDFSGNLTTGQPTPVSASGIGDALNGLAGSLSNSTSKAFNALTTKLAFKQLELQDKRLDYENQLTDQQINQLKASTSYQELVNYITDSTKDFQIKLSCLQVEQLLSQILLNNINAEWLPKQIKAQINKLNAETASTNYNWQRYLPAYLALQQQLADSSILMNQSNIGLNTANLEKIAADIENLKVSNAGVKELKKTIDKMPDGIGKSFMMALLVFLQSGQKF